MHCPSCGQQQISNETKFCSRCGMPLTLVSEVVVHGGYLPQLAELENQPGSIYTRRNGVAFSLFWLIFWLLIMAVVFGGILNIDLLGELFSVIGIFGGLLILLVSVFFLKKTPKKVASGAYMQQPAPGLYGPPPQAALPPQAAQSYAQRTVGAWRDTNDLEPTASEGATQILHDEERHSQAIRRCSACNTTYTDPSLRYCLVDGETLTDLSSDTETVVRRTNDL
jgi:hypothetical protein